MFTAWLHVGFLKFLLEILKLYQVDSRWCHSMYLSELQIQVIHKSGRCFAISSLLLCFCFIFYDCVFTNISGMLNLHVWSYDLIYLLPFHIFILLYCILDEVCLCYTCQWLVSIVFCTAFNVWFNFTATFCISCNVSVPYQDIFFSALLSPNSL